jgi:hypothetical protein
VTTCHIYTYDPTSAQYNQVRDWDCSAAATAWMGRSLGWGWQELDVAYSFVAQGLATPQLGLLDGSGAGIVGWLAQQPFTATNDRVGWDWVTQLLHTCPLIMGSSAWYHWVGVRYVQDDGQLALANSAPGWGGIYQTMSIEQFNRFGDFYAVFPS